MSLFESLQNSAFTDWFLGSESIWTYPTVLTLHTVGLAVLVGASIVLHLRVLGVGAAIRPSHFLRVYSFIWPAFFLNLATGLVLFVTQAADRVTQPLFYLKLASIGVALWLGGRARRTLIGGAAAIPTPAAASIKNLALSALGLWTVAIVAGRLMAYFSGR